MSVKKIIPCLDTQNGKVVKGVHFINIKEVGDPVELAQKYERDGADELVLLDITATLEKRKTLTALVKQVAQKIQIPLTVGGGVNSLALAQEVIAAGADKISIGSAAVKDPELISLLSQKLGKERVVIAIDTQEVNGKDYVFIKGGKEKTELETLAWARQIEALGAGAILLTSMNADGAKTGFACDITDAVSKAVRIPVTASGGAGKTADFITLFKKTEAAAGLAASIFHYGEVSIPELKTALKQHHINVK